MSIERKKKINEFNEYAFSLFIAIGVALAVFSFGTLSFTNGESMLPTLQNGDVTVVKYSKNPSHGDIIVFKNKYEGGKELLIKRVIGTPGDHVQIKDGDVYVNEVKQDQSFTLNQVTEGKDDITLGQDEYYVLGDNRENSIDSRESEVGAVHRSEILGIAKKVVLPFQRAGSLSGN